MRICLISREYPPETGWGGIGAYTYQHARALKQLGHDVEVVALCQKETTMAPAPVDDEGITVHRCVWGPLLQELSTVWISLPYSHYVLKCATALWHRFEALHAANPFDVVEAPEHLAEALLPSLTHVCPLVIRLHTPHSKFIEQRYHNLSPSFDQELVSILERTAILEADVLSSPSEDLARYVAKDCGIPEAQICIVRNPVDTVKFTPTGSQALGLQDKITVFFAGRLEARKGIHHLIDAIPKVMARTDKVRFVVVGADTRTGPGKTSVLNELRMRLQASGSLNHVTFINHVSLPEMPAHYRSADICVVPSLYENAPYTVLEAMACGKPVIGSSAGGTPEYVHHGVTGIVVPPADPNALAEAILELATNEAKRLAYGDAARSMAQNSFDKLVIANQAVDTYKLAIQQHSQRALYRRPAEECLKDAVSLLASYHRNLCELIYVHSFQYRMKYWIQQFMRRPKLAAARCVVAALKPITPAGKAAQMLESLEHKVTESMHQAEEAEVASLQRNFSTPPHTAQAARKSLLQPTGARR